MPDDACEIRPIRFEERAEWEPLWIAYQAFYKVVISDETTTVTWARLHDPAEPMDVLGAYIGGGALGRLAPPLLPPSPTIRGNSLPHALVFAEGARHLGLGRALIAAVEERARRAGASRVYWLTQESNATARALYDKLAERSGFIQYRKLF